VRNHRRHGGVDVPSGINGLNTDVRFHYDGDASPGESPAKQQVIDSGKPVRRA
jgi:hypothetical protein